MYIAQLFVAVALLYDALERYRLKVAIIALGKILHII